MNAATLETRTTAAEQDPALIRPLIRDFKAHKDAQLDRLTQRVNEADARVDAAKADADARVSEIKAKLETVIAKIEANPEAAQVVADEIAAAKRNKRQQRLAEIAVEKARLAEEEATLTETP